MRKIVICLVTVLLIVISFSSKCDARVKYIKATKIGMIRDDRNAAEKNYKLLKKAISRRQNIKLNGIFYVNFSEPIILDYNLHVSNGEMRIVSGNCFDFVNNGGFVANNTIFRRNDVNEDNIFCGRWEKYDRVKLDKFHFINSEYYGKFLLQISYNDMNSDTDNFGVNDINVSKSYLFNGGRVELRNGVIWNKCVFQDNVYEKFPITPIYIVYSHSSKTYPNEPGTYKYVEENYCNSSSVVIDGNFFEGKIHSYNNYYCSALVQSRVCYFTNNHLRDIINYANGETLPNATCYDAYLSCSEVYFSNNLIENMVSFSMGGANKPQCEIGKSKTDLMSEFGSKTIRHYENNTYIIDGDKILSLGADRNSIYTSIFENSDPIYSYKWNNNKILYRNADLHGRKSSISYYNFELNNNIFHVHSIKNLGLCYMSTKSDFESVKITNNSFNVSDGSAFYLFNQLYSPPKDDAEPLGSILIEDNTFTGATPKIVFNKADKVIIRNNMSSATDFNGNYFITDDASKKAILRANEMDVNLPFLTNSMFGSATVTLSTKSSGRFKYSLPFLSKNKSLEGNIFMLNDKHLEFNITYMVDGNIIKVPITIEGDNTRVSFEIAGHTAVLSNQRYNVIYSSSGIIFKIKFDSLSGLLSYYLTSQDKSCNDAGSIISLEILM